jgi:NTP pyrophosphatase (non-canonical NTP hydrolase)
MVNMNVSEEWKPIDWIVGYSGYDVSNTGKVRCWNPRNKHGKRPKEPRVLTPNMTSNGGYAWVSLYGNGIPHKMRIHDLVMRAFVGPRPDGLIIRHLDGTPTNNNLDNLVYGTYSDNSIEVSLHRKAPNPLKYLDEIGHICNDVATAKGFWDNEPGPDVYLAKMALLHSEVSEILEAYRKQMGSDQLTDEFADVFIRLVDLWAVMHDEGLVGSLRDAILTKMNDNNKRPRLHGNLL